MITRSHTIARMLAIAAIVNGLAWAGGFVDLMEYADEAEFLGTYTKLKDENTGAGDWDAVFDGDALVVDEFSNVDVAWWNHVYARRHIGAITGDVKIVMHFAWQSDNPGADRGRLGVELLTAPGSGVNVNGDWPDDHVAEVGVFNDWGAMAMSMIYEEAQRWNDVDRTDAFPFAPFSNAGVAAVGSATATIQRVGDQLTMSFELDGGGSFGTATRADSQLYEWVGIVVEDFNGYPGSYDGNPVFAVDTLSVLTGNIVGSVTETGGSTAVEEGGATDSYEVVLNEMPAGELVLKVLPIVNGYNVRLNGGDPNDSVSFAITPADWDQPRVVTVEAVDDALVEGDHTAVISHTYTSATDPNAGVADYVFVSIADNDVGVRLVESDGATEVVEGGATDSYSLVLKAPAAAGQTVTITAQTDGETVLLSAGGGEAAQSVALTFDGSNWDVPQEITVIAVDDEVLDFDHVSVISHTVTSGDAQYDGFAVPAVNATVHDNECGAWGMSTVDMNQDCVVDLLDLSLLANSWLECTMPFVPGCIEPGGEAVFYSEGSAMEGYYAGYGTNHMGETEVALLYGSNSGANQARATFTLSELPLRNQFVYVRGHNDDVVNTVESALWLNGVELMRGNNVFTPDGSWAVLSVPIPVGVLRVGSNEVIFSNESGGYVGSFPWMLVDWLAVGPLGYEPAP